MYANLKSRPIDSSQSLRKPISFTGRISLKSPRCIFHGAILPVIVTNTQTHLNVNISVTGILCPVIAVAVGKSRHFGPRDGQRGGEVEAVSKSIIFNVVSARKDLSLRSSARPPPLSWPRITVIAGETSSCRFHGNSRKIELKMVEN